MNRVPKWPASLAVVHLLNPNAIVCGTLESVLTPSVANMARGRRRPLHTASLSDLPVDDAPSAGRLPDEVDNNDEIDEFVAQRHKVLLENARDSDEDSEIPEEEQDGVYDIQLSDSDSNDVDNSEDDGENLSDDDVRDQEGDDSDDNAHNKEDDFEDWGGRRRRWYGGDTHEYEIMEDDERAEALRDEEEEAQRLQRKALITLRPEDFQDDFDEGVASDTLDDQQEAARAPQEQSSAHADAAMVVEETAPELPVLLREMQHYYDMAARYKSRLTAGPITETRYHLCVSYVTNVAFYLALRTDPDSVGTDMRQHKVVEQIVRLRALLKDHEMLECENPVSRPLGNGVTTSKATAVSGMKPTRSKKKRGAPRQRSVASPAAETVLESVMEPSGDQSRAEGSSNVKDDTPHAHRLLQPRGKLRTSLSGKDDADLVNSLIRPLGTPRLDIEVASAAKSEAGGALGVRRRNLNRITGAIESEIRNEGRRRIAPVDADHVRDGGDPQKSEATPMIEAKELGNSAALENEEDDELVARLLAKRRRKEARLSRKNELAKPHVYTFKDSVEKGARRRASSQVVMNRGLTRYRPREKKTPRTKNKLAYTSAVKRRKGMVRDPVAVKPGVSYGGEASGINVRARRGAKLSDV